MDLEKKIDKAIRKINPKGLWQEWSTSKEAVEANICAGEILVQLKELGVWVAYKIKQ